MKLIKEAELQLDAVSRPTIVRFSKGTAQGVEDEEDIGPQIVHAYTLTNQGESVDGVINSSRTLLRQKCHSQGETCGQQL